MSEYFCLRVKAGDGKIMVSELGELRCHRIKGKVSWKLPPSKGKVTIETKIPLIG